MTWTKVPRQILAACEGYAEVSVFVGVPRSYVSFLVLHYGSCEVRLASTSTSHEPFMISRFYNQIIVTQTSNQSLAFLVYPDIDPTEAKTKKKGTRRPTSDCHEGSSRRLLRNRTSACAFALFIESPPSASSLLRLRPRRLPTARLVFLGGLRCRHLSSTEHSFFASLA
jgi:hypothetical protein